MGLDGHRGDASWVLSGLKSRTTRLFVEQLVLFDNKENMGITGFLGESTGDQWIPFTMGEYCVQCLSLVFTVGSS